jgi:hypothetical protein
LLHANRPTWSWPRSSLGFIMTRSPSTVFSPGRFARLATTLATAAPPPGLWRNNAIPELNQPTEGTCRACGRELIACKHWRQWVCSDACRMRVRRAKRRTAKPRQSCTVCGKRFAARRSDARTCSPACRQRAYRDRAELTARLGNNHDGKQRFGKNAVRHLGAAALLFRATGKTTRPHKPVMPLRPGFAKKNMSSATRLRTRRCCGARVTAGHLPSAVQHA